MSLEAGESVGPYTIVSTFGTGVYATEYLATRSTTIEAAGDTPCDDDDHQAPERPSTVVLSVLGRLHRDDAQVAERFDDVAVSLKWADCESTERVVEIGTTDDGLPWVAREWNDRGTLHDRIRIGRGATTRDLRRLVELCASATITFDELGLPCREIHPTGVLLHAGETSDTPSGSDLGLLWEDDHLRLAAPAPIERGETDRAVRLHSLDRLLCEAALGRPLAEEEALDEVCEELGEIGRGALGEALAEGSASDASDADDDLSEATEAESRPEDATEAWRDRILVALTADEVSLGGGGRTGRLSEAAQERLAVLGGSIIAMAIAVGAVGLGLWSGSGSAASDQQAADALAFVDTPAGAEAGLVGEDSPATRIRTNIPPADALQCVEPAQDPTVGEVELVEVTDQTVHIGWADDGQDVTVRFNGRRMAKVREGEQTLTVDRLRPDTLFVVEVSPLGADTGAVVCAQTFPAPTPAPNPDLELPAGTKVLTAD